MVRGLGVLWAMALNIKPIFPKDHPEVTCPDERTPIGSDTSGDHLDQKKDHNLEKKCNEEAKRLLKEKSEPPKKQLDIIK